MPNRDDLARQAAHLPPSPAPIPPVPAELVAWAESYADPNNSPTMRQRLLGDLWTYVRFREAVARREGMAVPAHLSEHGIYVQVTQQLAPSVLRQCADGPEVLLDYSLAEVKRLVLAYLKEHPDGP